MISFSHSHAWLTLEVLHRDHEIEKILKVLKQEFSPRKASLSGTEYLPPVVENYILQEVPFACVPQQDLFQPAFVRVLNKKDQEKEFTA